MRHPGLVDERNSGLDVTQITLTFTPDETVDLAPRDIAAMLVDLEAALELATRASAASSRALRPPRPQPPLGVVPAGPTRWVDLQSRLSRSVPGAICVRRIHYGSPLKIVVELPWQIYAVAGPALLCGLGFMFSAPYRAMGAVHLARADFWNQRLLASRARRAYLEWRRVENRALAQLVEIEAPSLQDEIGAEE